MTGLGVPACAEVPLTGVPPRFELEPWRREWGLVAGITGRAGGWNLGPWTDEPAHHVMDRWVALLAAMSPRFSSAVVGRQVHGTAVAVHSAAIPGLVVVGDRDGHLTDQAGVLLAVTVADCIPVYLAHPDSGTVALLHAGWRGVAAGIVEQGVNRLTSFASCSPADIVIHCGVGICGSCYEVGPEVVRALTGRQATSPERVDLREVAAAQARAVGVQHVTASTWCTAHDRERFYSHRASAGRDGRQVAYLGRPMA